MLIWLLPPALRGAPFGEVSLGMKAVPRVTVSLMGSSAET